MKNIAIYVRVSTSDKGQTTENQEIDLLNYCEEKKYAVYKIYRDYIGGGKIKSQRQGLSQLFEDGKNKLFDSVLFWSIDRFTREGTQQLFNYLNELLILNIDWISLREVYLNDITKNFKPVIISLLAAIAAEEKDNISARTKAGLRRTVIEGTRLGAPVRIDRDRVRELQGNGMTNYRIAKELKCSITAIDKITNTFKRSTNE